MNALAGLFRFILVIAMTGCFAAMACATEPGQCAAPDAMTAMLKAEGQRSIVSAQRVTLEKELRGIIVTMNADRSVGYILEANQPLGDPATSICVHTRLAGVRLFDARKPGTPPAVLLQASDAEALRRCDELAKAGTLMRGGCGAFNQMTRKVEAWGERVMVQGFIADKQADGSFAPNGGMATLSGRINGSVNDFPNDPALGIAGAITQTALPEGASFIRAVLVYPGYTSYALELLR